MKRVGNLYNAIFTRENIKSAIVEASKNKRGRKRSVRHCLENMDAVADTIMSNPHITGDYRAMVRKDPSSLKERNILVPPFFPDQIIHHAVIRVILPHIEKSFYRYSCSCIKGRGQLYASNHLRKAIATDRANTKWFIKLDIRRYYESVDHSILKEKLARKFKDGRLLALLDEIIDSVPKGIPIGNYTSQILSNFFLTGLDHRIKEELGVKHYLRFADDMVLMSSSRKRLMRCVETIKIWLAELKLETHGGEQARRLCEGSFIDFVGYRHYRCHTSVRRRIFKRFRRLCLRLRKAICVSRARRFMSYWGYSIHSDSNLMSERYTNGLRIGLMKAVISERNSIYEMRINQGS